jgi:hypothetical protein
MRRTLAFVVVLAIGSAGTALFVSHRLHSRHAAELAAQQAAWQQEKSELETALANARAPRPESLAPARAQAPVPAMQRGPTPAELVARLRALRIIPGASQTRAARLAIHDFEEMIAAGTAALPAVREFLARNEDLDFAGTGSAKGGRGSVPDDFVLPPSLRFGFFDVVKQIGGPDAEQLLANTLETTGRGAELAWLARALQGMAPNKYREVALAAARELLARPFLAKPGSPLDLNDRDHLFSVLAMYGDTAYVSTAQSQLVQSDGALDRGALKYLQQSLGPQAVTIAAQAYQNPLLFTNAAAKEPLARLALNFVGADPQANAFYEQAINDPVLTKGHRKNLIEDLNQDGFADLKNLGPQDLPLIQSRIALIEQLAPGATDPVNVAAFKEAYKDLLNMQERILRPKNPTP